MTVNENPWKDLNTPEPIGFSARRIAGVGSTQWGLYWAVDRQRHYMLIMTHEVGIRSQHRWPNLRGLRIERQPDEDGHRELLVFRLEEAQHLDIFYRFCADIADALGAAETGQEALDISIMRTWRWHRLLKVRRDGRLTVEEQKGLIGELSFLEQYVMPEIGSGQGVRSWGGPLGAQRDFEIGTTGVECKAYPPLASALRISSADQLDSTHQAPVFLYAIEIAESRGKVAGAITVTDAVDQVKKLIEGDDMTVHEDFEERLWAIGYNHEDDYIDQRWIIGNTSFYKVVAGFPRITPAMLPVGVMRVRYRIALAQCEEFRVDVTAVTNSFFGVDDDDTRIR